MTGKHWIDLFSGLVVTVLVLLGIEASLAAAGLGKIPAAANWSRGFDSTARYLVPVPDQPGAWQTRFKHQRRPEVTVTPKTDKVRILAFGGSNTAGFEIEALGEILNEEVGEQRFEAFNLGRAGYGSERVKFIFHQAIEDLDPEIVIIYTGHNEFVERGFMMDLEFARTGDWANAPLQIARKTRMFNALVGHYSRQGLSPQSEPEAWSNEYSKFADITYDETLEYFKAYEENLRAMCDEAVAKGIEVVLCTIVHNRLAVPFSSSFSDDLSAEAIEEFEKNRRAALRRIPGYLKTLLPQKETQRLHANDFSMRKLNRDLPNRALSREDYDGWSRATGLLKDRDPMLQPSSRWAPIAFEMYDTVMRFQNRDLGDKKRDSIVRAEKQLEMALAIYPEHPRALFELALVKHLLGRKSVSVLGILNRAASLDRAPRKGSELTNNIVRRVAADTKPVVLADIDTAFQDCLPDGLVGWEWMADHCHLNRGGRDAIVALLADSILENWRDISVSVNTSN